MAIETVLLHIAVLLVSAKLLGELFERIGLSSIIGEVLAGIIVGPSLLNIVQPTEIMTVISTLGILFLMFLIGLHAKFEEALENNVYSAATMAVLGGSLSFAFAFLAGIGLGYSLVVAVTVGAALTSTGMGITVRALSGMGHFYGKVSKALVATNVADDVFSVIVMTLFLGFLQYGRINIMESWHILLIVIGFFIVMITFGSKIAAKIMNLTVKMKDQESMIAIPVVIMFLIALLSQQVNIAGITGAFLAGIILSKTQHAETVIAPKASTLGYGFLIPLFFAYTGVNVDILSIGAMGVLLLVVLLVAGIAGKYFGTYAGARLHGFEHSESVKLGWGMIPRTEYTLVIGQAALVIGAITSQIYSVLIVLVLVLTMITPVILKAVYENI